ncbi:MAG TPA: sel1 repeat family protein [Rhizobiales bacterium]|nr:sel1 repeat family protein [Hyphomicrobiales bacterium]
MWISRSVLHIALALVLLGAVAGYAPTPAGAAEASLSFAGPPSSIRELDGEETHESDIAKSKPGSGKNLLSRSAALLRSLLKRSPQSEFEEISKKAKQGDLFAKWRLARMYEAGEAVKKDNGKAYRLFREVASKHKASDRYSSRKRITIEALVDIACLLRVGVPEAGIKKNPVRAHQLLQYVASMFGHARAQYLLGQMNISGEGTKPRFKQGMRWLSLAARKKNAAAQAALGQYYLGKPKTGKPDRVRGLMWLSLARENEKDQKAREQISQLYEATLTETSSSERERAGHLATIWKQRYGGKDANE